MNKRMYEITDELREIFDIIEEAEGEITPEIEERLAIAEEEYENKIMSYYRIIQENKAQNQSIKDEIDRLNRIAYSNNRIEEKLKGRILVAVQEFGYVGKSNNMKLDLDKLKLWTVNKDKIVIEDEESFNDPKYTFTDIRVPNDPDLLREVLRHTVALSVDKEFVAELNSELKTYIAKNRLKNALQLGGKVKGVSIINDPYLVMK